MSKTKSTRYNDIVCIGAGISGIGLGAQLKRKWNFTDIHIYDRNESFGGTWFVNRYPGVGCDVPHILYSFSFFRNDDTSSIFCSGPRIYNYLARVIDKYQLQSCMTFSTQWLSATWDETRHLWVLELQSLKTGEKHIHECRVLYSAIGLLTVAKSPDIPGLATFKGSLVHTSEWPENVDVTDKSVIVIGNGCSATQVIPKILPSAKSITQFFRSAHYYYPIRNEPYRGFLKWGMDHLPGFSLFIRLALFHILERYWRGFVKDQKGDKVRARETAICTQYMERTAPEKYHSILTPDYPLGCKRRICDDRKTGYLPSLHSPKIFLTKDPIIEIVPEGVRTADKTYSADIIIAATGYDTGKACLQGVSVRGRNGESLDGYWKKTEVPTAYHTTSMPGFPNFFILFGPNSPSGHTSAIIAIENIINYSMKLIQPIVISKNALEVDVRPEAAEAYYRDLERENQNIVVGSCSSLYLLNGKNRGLYPWSQFHLWRRCAFPIWRDLSYVTNNGDGVASSQKSYVILMLLIVTAALSLQVALWTKRTPWGDIMSVIKLDSVL